jgi:hypothetical protein
MRLLMHVVPEVLVTLRARRQMVYLRFQQLLLHECQAMCFNTRGQEATPDLN